jgi:para-aminobenzoate synthetase/4-amino-4-deoxychorismate lyase
MKISDIIENEKDFALLCSLDAQSLNQASYIFYEKEAILSESEYKSHSEFFNAIEKNLHLGKMLSGFFKYEFSYNYHPRLKFTSFREDLGPLAFFGVFKKMKRLTETDILELANSPKYKIKNGPLLEQKEPPLDFETYKNKLHQLKHFLENGDSYQVNFTFPLKYRSRFDEMTLFLNLLKEQPVGFAAFLALENERILSFSPELFFQKTGPKIMTKPMKGTAERIGEPKQDRKIRELLSQDVKNQSENLMIVDLLRNDLSSISKKSSVVVEDLFKIEEYRTLFQMTSKIQALIKEDIPIEVIFKALFPCASITGAPKFRTMEIITELEDHYRGLYTGSIGYFLPNRDMCFNVAIRTLVQNQNKDYTFGVGGGILYESKIGDEYNEALLKSKFLNIT